jgi:hypothetical protein
MLVLVMWHQNDTIYGCTNNNVSLLLDAEYQSCSTIFKNIVKNEGPRNLMKGLIPRLLVVPSMMSFWYVINEELVKRFYK